MENMNTKTIESLKKTLEAREASYGEARYNFTRIASLWRIWLQVVKGEVVNLCSRDVAAMMILFKLARLSSNIDDLDTWLDIAGYGVCGGSIVAEDKEDKAKRERRTGQNGSSN